MRATRLLAAAAVSFAVFGSDQLQADDWPAAKPITIFTEDASRFIRILPGVSLGDLVGFSGAAYPAQRLGALPRSTSSRSWRCAPNHFVAAEGAEVYVPEHFGGHFVFQMKDGTFRYTPGARQECNPMPRSQP